MKKKQSSLESTAPGYRMLLPAALLFLLINTIPFLYGVVLSFTNTNYFRPQNGSRFVGLQNYLEILQNEDFYRMFSFTLLYTVLVVLLSYALGMAFALLLNRDIRFKNFFRGLALLPWIMAPAVAVVIWRWMCNDQLGAINVMLKSIGLIQTPIRFLSDKTLAKVTVVAFAVWKCYPFMMVVLLGGLQSIGKEVYEPARIDGASKWACFRYITLPLLRPVSIVALSLMFIWTFNTNSFDNIYLLTRGGPVNSTYVLSIEAYYAAFYRGKAGYASAASLLMTVFIALAALSYTLLRRARAGKGAAA